MGLINQREFRTGVIRVAMPIICFPRTDSFAVSSTQQIDVTYISSSCEIALKVVFLTHFHQII